MRGLLSIFLFCICLSVQSQHPYYYTLNDENGLPSNEVYQVIQDDFGFMWIGCDAGLFRYDGFNFKPYTCTAQNSKSISNLKKDKNGKIWCQNFTGQIFRADEDSLFLFYDASIDTRQYPAYTIDSKNKIWIGCDNKIIILDYNGKLIKELKGVFGSNPIIQFYDIEELKNGKIYLSTAYGTNYIVDLNYKVNPVLIPLDTQPKSELVNVKNHQLLFIETIKDRKYFVSPIDKNGNTTEMFELPSEKGAFQYYITELDSYLYLCGSDGIYVMDKNFALAPEFPVLFKGQKISFLYKDKEGNIWATSLQDGIFIIPSVDIRVWNKSNSILADNNISVLKGNAESVSIYTGTYTGLLYDFNFTENSFRLISDNTNNQSRAIRSVSQLNDAIFIAKGSFFIKNGNTEEKIDPLNNSRDFVLRNDTIFYITVSRIGYYSLKDKKATSILEKGGRKVAIDPVSGKVYFACDHGLFVWNGKLNEIKSGGKPVYVSDLTYDKEKIYLATQNSEIFTLQNSKLEKFKIQGVDQETQIKSIHITDGSLLFSGSKGLYIYQPLKENLRIVNFYDGLAFKEINDILVINNHVFLATLKGIVMLPLDIEVKNSNDPKIKITGVSSEKIRFIDIKNVQVQYGDINLKINFISNAFRSRGNFHYEYRIKNFSDDWIKISSNSPFVSIPFLPSGDFIFEVVAVNEDGIRSEIPATVSIHVDAPYWEKWWFYLLIILSVLLISGVLFYFRVRYLKQKALAQNRVLLSQLTALKAQMNPHFMYNTLNSIQDLILQNDIKSTNYYLSKFSTLMRMILKASDSSKITLEEEIEILELYLALEKLRFGNDFNYEIKTHLKKGMQMMIPSMILQPFVENAIKHGLLHKKGVKNLVIEFNEEHDHLNVIIKDNGVGRQKSAEIKARQTLKHASFATQATEKRIELLSQYDRKNYSVEIEDLFENNEAAGTKITVRIPF